MDGRRYLAAVEGQHQTVGEDATADHRADPVRLRFGRPAVEEQTGRKHDHPDLFRPNMSLPQ